ARFTEPEAVNQRETDVEPAFAGRESDAQSAWQDRELEHCDGPGTSQDAALVTRVLVVRRVSHGMCVGARQATQPLAWVRCTEEPRSTATDVLARREPACGRSDAVGVEDPSGKRRVCRE